MRTLPLVAVMSICSLLISAPNRCLAAMPEQPDGAQKSACDELWIVSTRHLDCPCSKGYSTFDLDVLRHECHNGWQDGDLDQLLFDDDPSLVTAIYVHGNRIEPDEVEPGAWQAYDGLRCTGGPPTRVVFWSWPSDKIPGQLRDIRYKMHRADCEAHHLARFLARRQSTNRLVLVGYSFGARVVAGALELMAEVAIEPDGPTVGEPHGLEPHGLRPKPAVTLVAPAIDRYALSSCGEFSNATAQSAEMLILYNSLDPVLKRFWLTEPACKPDALGYLGLPDMDLGPILVEQRDVRHLIGKVHHYRYYFGSCAVRELLRSQICGTAVMIQ